MFTRDNDTPVTFTLSLEGKPSTPVPESSTILGVIALGCLGVMQKKRVTKIASAKYEVKGCVAKNGKLK